MKSTKKAAKPSKRLQYPAQAAMRRAAKRAREIARKFGTPVYYMKDGKIIEEWP